MAVDSSSFNGGASRNNTSYMGVATNLQGGAAAGTNDIFVGSTVSVRSSGGDMISGSASVESGQPINGANDITSTNMVTSLSQASNFLSSKKVNEGNAPGTPPLF